MHKTVLSMIDYNFKGNNDVLVPSSCRLWSCFELWDNSSNSITQARIKIVTVGRFKVTNLYGRDPWYRSTIEKHLWLRKFVRR